MKFLYRNAKGIEKTHQLSKGWKEQGRYIIGFSETDMDVRTFLIYRVVQFFDGSEKLLAYPDQPPPLKKRADERTEILFTGFPAAQRLALETFAAGAGMKVVKTVTNGLDYLCVGPNAGPSKVDAARSRGLIILSEPNLKELVATGVLPDSEPDFL